MKIVIQNGSKHGFSRRQAEAMVELFPQSWRERIDSLVLYKGDESILQVKYYPKAGCVGVFWPAPAQPQPQLAAAAEELLILLHVAVERSTLPARISNSQRVHARDQTARLLAKCVEVLGENDA